MARTEERRASGSPPRILLVCPHRWDEDELGRGAFAREVEVHPIGGEIYAKARSLRALVFDVERLLARAVRVGRELGIGGAIGTGDYPSCILAAAVARELGLCGPDPAAVILASHKFHFREVCARAVPEASPAFALVDPRARPLVPPLPYPFFVKPVKGMMSARAGRAASDEELARLLHFSMVERIGARLLMRPFDRLRRRYTDLQVPAERFVAEEVLRGEQVTLDGLVQRGRVVVLGIVDSVLFPGTISFERFEYPSRLPAPVQARMAEIAERLVPALGLDECLFNLELFWDAERDRIGVIELNPRMAYQFADLHEKVDGTNLYALQLALALGREPVFRRGAGTCRAATSFVLRRFQDARVRRVPSEPQLAALRERFIGVRIHVLARVGRRLSQQIQDPHSFRYGIVNLGGPSREELRETFEAVRRELRFEFAPAPPRAAGAGPSVS